MRTHCEEMKDHGKEIIDSPQRQKKAQREGKKEEDPLAGQKDGGEGEEDHGLEAV